MVGHASACQRPLAGVFFLTFSGSGFFTIRDRMCETVCLARAWRRDLGFGPGDRDRAVGKAERRRLRLVGFPQLVLELDADRCAISGGGSGSPGERQLPRNGPILDSLS